MTSEEKEDKVPNQFKPQKLTLLFAGLAFIFVCITSFGAVLTANQGQNAARREAEQARIESTLANERLQDVQDQLNCTNKVVMNAVRGSLQNSILQDDLLLASVSGTGREQIQKSLADTKANLISLLVQVDEANQECTK